MIDGNGLKIGRKRRQKMTDGLMHHACMKGWMDGWMDDAIRFLAGMKKAWRQIPFGLNFSNRANRQYLCVTG
jgi:hypothetical protein